MLSWRGKAPIVKILATVSALLWGAAVVFPQAAEATCVRNATHRVLGNDFEVQRGMDKYLDDFPGLQRDLSRPRARWLDAGAGEARAQTQTLVCPRFKGLQCVAVGAEMPESARELIELSEMTGNFRYLSGRYIEDIPAAELGKFDVITDYYGPLSYTAYPDEVLDRYLGALRPGGSLHLMLDSSTYVETPRGATPFVDWLKKTLESQGCEVELADGPKGRGDKRMRVRAPAERREFRVPRLEVVDYHDNTPPSRVFKPLREGARPEGALRRDFDFDRRVRGMVRDFLGRADPFGTPEIYRLMREEPERGMSILDRWYGARTAHELTERLRGALPARFVANLIDPGVATRLDRFIEFARAELVRRPDLSPEALREAFAAHLGNARVYYRRVLTKADVPAIRRTGILSEVAKSKKESVALNDYFTGRNYETGLMADLQRQADRKSKPSTPLIPVSTAPSAAPVRPNGSMSGLDDYEIELEVPAISVIEPYPTLSQDPKSRVFLFQRVPPDRIRSIRRL